MKPPLFKSLQFRLPSLVLLGVIPTTIMAIAISSSHASKIIHQDYLDNLALKGQSLHDTIDRWTQMNFLALKNLARQPDIISIDPQKQKPILEAMVNNYEYIYLAHTLDLQGLNIARSDNKAPQNYSDSNWFKAAKAGEEITFQTLIESTSKKSSLCFATPISQQTTIAGVASICTLLEELARQIGDVTFGQTGYGFIVNERGYLLTHPNADLISDEELIDYSAYPPVANLLAGNDGYFSFTDTEGVEWVSHGMRLSNGWGVLILQQKSEALLQEKEFHSLAAMVAGIAILAVGILTWLLTSRLISPLNQITAVATNVNQGNFDRTLEVEREDEIGILAATFNSTIEQLQHYLSNSQECNLELDRLVQQKNIAEQEQKLAKEKLERQVRELETKLASVHQGDLTIKAAVTDDELGRVSASYNSMVESLKTIVARVQTATQTVAKTANSGENAIESLSQGATKQTAEIEAILAKLESMNSSIQNVALNAEQAEIIIKQASTKVKAGDLAIERTVEKIVALGQTTTETKEQAKRLGKASRKISKAVELIRKIALQTNVLAVNTSIEAARAGEEGLGFTVVAEEVQSLAAQSAQTATEIEKLVLEMQAETRKVIQAMEDSNNQMLAGSKQVEKTRFALQEITTASQDIDRLVEAISRVAGEHSQTSQVITATIQEVAAIAQDNSTSVNYVSDAYKDLIAVTQELQASMSQFKVN